MAKPWAIVFSENKPPIIRETSDDIHKFNFEELVNPIMHFPDGSLTQWGRTIKRGKNHWENIFQYEEPFDVPKEYLAFALLLT